MRVFELSKYRDILKVSSFRNFWLGFLVSNLGDAMTKVALNWFVWEQTRSAAALGLLTFLYLGPVIVGGFLAGWLLDAFDKRKLMIVDSLFRGLVVAAFPLLYYLGLLEVWHAYVVAAIYGLLAMIIWAGGPSIVPTLVEDRHLPTANALEAFAWTIGNVAGPAIAGLLIARIGAPNVLLLDAVSYLLFVGLLLGVRLPPAEVTDEAAEPPRYREAFGLLVGNSIIASITVMFFVVNLANGLLLVWLPIYADLTLGGGAALYGGLLGVMSLGEVLSSFAAGGINYRISLGRLIALALFVGGFPFALLLVRATPAWTAAMLFLVGFAHAPVSIWAQTLRMRIIPARLRGRMFSLIRLTVLTGYPLGGALAGLLTPLAGISGIILISSGLFWFAGLGGLAVRDLRESDRVMAEMGG